MITLIIRNKIKQIIKIRTLSFRFKIFQYLYYNILLYLQYFLVIFIIIYIIIYMNIFRRISSTIIFLLFITSLHAYNNWKQVTGLVGKTVDYGVYTGYIQLNVPEAKCTQNGMFFQYASKDGQNIDKINKDSPVLIWLNGGPGSSSQLGAWSEVGPFAVTKDYQVVERQYRWNKLAHLIFIDQPISNVGLTFCQNSSYLVNSTHIAAGHFLQFIQNLFTISNLKVLRNNPIIFLGESYGGHYVPYFTNQILKNNKLNLNIRSVAVADGWVNPQIQLLSYHSMMSSTGIMNRNEVSTLQRQEGEAYSNILTNNLVQAKNIFDVMTDTQKYDVSVYNFLQGSHQEDLHQTWINTHKKDFGIPDFVTFHGGNEAVYDAFAADIVANYASQIQELLKVVKVVIYNGQLDLIVNTPAAYNFVNQLNWSKLSQWQKSEKKIWTVGGKVVGTAKDYDNLAFVVIYGAGHMVPTDQPFSSFDLASHIINMNNNWEN